MPQGFFAKSLVFSKKPSSGIPQCGSCGLYKQCQTPKMPVGGEGHKGILIVGEAPSKQEDKEGESFAGNSGEFLREKMKRLGIDLDRDCWRTNAIICRPVKNATPTSDQIDFCRPNLINTIKELKPKVIILLGGSALSSCIGWIWKENVGPITKWTGWNIPSQKLNAWVCPTFHPAYLLRMNDKVLDRMFYQHLKAAVAHKKRPWKKIPDYNSMIERVHDPKKAAAIIREFIAEGGMAAFDYEADRIKPESKDYRIVCASICMNGRRTISFPWIGEAKKAAIEFLKSPIKKIASNMKYEHRVTRRILGFEIRNWVLDTMLMAHILDNRQGITGLKFQTFVRLGIDSYNDHIEGLLNAPDSNSPNQIKEIDLDELLQYNGLDSLLEYLVAEQQLKEHDEACQK